MQRPDCDTIRNIRSIVFLSGGPRRPDSARRLSRPVMRCVPPPAMPQARPAEHMRRVIEASVGQVFGVLAEEFGMMTRGRARIAVARQIAMYLSHVACGQSLTDVGRLFARDRTTVAHACARIEDMRDDSRFDRVLDLLEAIVRHRMAPRGPGLDGA